MLNERNSRLRDFFPGTWKKKNSLNENVIPFERRLDVLDDSNMAIWQQDMASGASSANEKTNVDIGLNNLSTGYSYSFSYLRNTFN